jgi:serine/threonine protein kinase
MTESRIAASLDHPNVVPIYRAGEEDGLLFLAMRFVSGDDLRTLVEREGPLAPERAAAVIAQVAAALAAAHERGLVHRDVKPANVLVTADGHCYLTDCGLVKDPPERYRTAPDLAAALNDAVGSSPAVRTVDDVAEVERRLIEVRRQQIPGKVQIVEQLAQRLADLRRAGNP